MKKQIASFALFVLVGAATFAAAPKFSISLGGGPILGGSWSEAELKYEGGFLDGTKIEQKTKTFDVGGFLFGDFTFAELSAAYVYQTGDLFDVKMNGTRNPTGDGDYITHNVVIDLLGKYPFALGEKLSLYPALGAGLRLAIDGNKNSEKETDILWALSIKGGVGLDYSITEKLYIRCEALYAFQLASDKKGSTEVPSMGKNNFEAQNKGYYMGPQVKLAVGYKIK